MKTDSNLPVPSPLVTILYKGETALRPIIPRRLWFGSNQWHQEAQWLLDALDVDKGAERTFALKDVHRWFPWVGELVNPVPLPDGIFEDDGSPD